MPRLFTGIEIPSKVATQLQMLQAGLPGARWIKRENFHITLRFIGDVDGRVADEIIYALEQVQPLPFSIRLNGLDVFGRSKPHSLYAGVEVNKTLSHLQSEQERIMQRIGLKPDGRKFTPHVTLARFRSPNVDEIANWLSSRGDYSSNSFTVGRIALYSARESTGGGPYVIERVFPFESVPVI